MTNIELQTVRGPPPPLLLWSTNTYLKFRIEQNFIGQHFAWCSPSFDGAAQHRYAPGATQPASSDPCTIYRQLVHAIKTNDGHDAKIASQKRTIKALARQWLRTNHISRDQHDEIIAIVNRSAIVDWRRLIYVIPFGAISDRVQLVAREKRASHEPEYTLSDLMPHEFSIIEPVEC